MFQQIGSQFELHNLRRSPYKRINVLSEPLVVDSFTVINHQSSSEWGADTKPDCLDNSCVIDSDPLIKIISSIRTIHAQILRRCDTGEKNVSYRYRDKRDVYQIKYIELPQPANGSDGLNRQRPTQA